jgi:endonuclease/exonuclease/phosphatase family metal-dependent hydrolase
MRFRLISYNIHKGIGGVDRLYRLDRIIDVLGGYDADVIFLQEVDDGVPRSSRDRQVDVLGDALGLPHRAYQPNVILTQGHYGNAILSRYPLHDIHNIDLTLRMKKRRQALVARCQLSKQPRDAILLFNCHLGLAGYERGLQVARILDSDALVRTATTSPVIVGGDFNDVWGTLGRHYLEPTGFQAACRAIKTFPAVMPLRALDRIYYRGPLEFDHSFPSRSKVARRASDHLPVIVDFRAALSS